MKKIACWVIAVTFLVFLISWGVMGVKIFNNDYDFHTEACVGLVCIAICFGCLIGIKVSSARCPHCKRVRLDTGRYCSHCGKDTHKA